MRIVSLDRCDSKYLFLQNHHIFIGNSAVPACVSCLCLSALKHADPAHMLLKQDQIKIGNFPVPINISINNRFILIFRRLSLTVRDRKSVV